MRKTITLVCVNHSVSDKEVLCTKWGKKTLACNFMPEKNWYRIDFLYQYPDLVKKDSVVVTRCLYILKGFIAESVRSSLNVKLIWIKNENTQIEGRINKDGTISKNLIDEIKWDREDLDIESIFLDTIMIKNKRKGK